MVRTRRPDLHDPTRNSHRSLLSDPKKPRLFPRQLPHLHILGPRFLSPLSPYLSPRSPLSPRRLDFPLPLPPVRSASRHSRPHVLRSRDFDRSLALNNRRCFPHHRRIAPHLGVDGRLRDRVRSRCVPSSRGSLPRRSRASQFQIPLLPRRRCLFRRRGRRSRRRSCLRGVRFLQVLVRNNHHL